MILESILKDIREELTKELEYCGIMFRLFHRTKSESSIENKMSAKREKYINNAEKMQDLLALRITLYFSDDVEIVHQHLKSKPNFIDETIDPIEVDKFCPKRLNLVMRIPDSYRNEFKFALKDNPYSDLIDDTYEVQIRTILSEGWHEVEHDLRYKCHEDWGDHLEESRLLNGVYATLESAEWSMLTLFNRLSYSHYKDKKWSSMLRNKMRIRFSDYSISSEVLQYLDDKPNVAKQIFRVNRSKIIKRMMESRFALPLLCDTIVYVINHIEKIDKGLAEMADRTLLKELNYLFGEFE